MEIPFLVEMSDGDNGKDNIFRHQQQWSLKDEGDILVTNSFDTISCKNKFRKRIVYNLKKGE